MQIRVNTDHNIEGREALVARVRGIVESALSRWIDHITRVEVPLVEFEIYGKSDPKHRVGAGLSTADVGIRVRYAFRREFAPYVGLVWSRKFFSTADLANAVGEPSGRTRVSAGLRFWF